MSNVRAPRAYIEATGFVVSGDDESKKQIAIGFKPETEFGIYLTVEEGRVFADTLRRAVGEMTDSGFEAGDGAIILMRPTKTGLVLHVPGEDGKMIFVSVSLDLVRHMSRDIVHVGGSMDHGATESDRPIRG